MGNSVKDFSFYIPESVRFSSNISLHGASLSNNMHRIKVSFIETGKKVVYFVITYWLGCTFEVWRTPVVPSFKTYCSFCKKL